MCDDDVAVADLLAGNDRFPTLLLASSGPEGFVLVSWSVGCPAFRSIRLIEDTDGILFGSQIRCPSNWSRISHANKAGFSDFNLSIRLTTDGVATCC